MQTVNQQVVLSVADGTEVHAYIAAPAGGDTYPGLLFLQEAFGINPHIRETANRLASEGYVVIAPQLFHRTAAPGAEFAYNDWATINPHFTAITLQGLQADLQAAYQWLQQQPKVAKANIGSIGFCLGGRVSFIANFTLQLQAGVSFYGGGTHNFAGYANQVHAPHLFIWAGLDNHILPEHVEAVTTAMKENNKPFVNVVFSNAEHAFNNNNRPSFNAQASAEAWALTLSFLKNKLQ